MCMARSSEGPTMRNCNPCHHLRWLQAQRPVKAENEVLSRSPFYSRRRSRLACDVATRPRTRSLKFDRKACCRPICLRLRKGAFSVEPVLALYCAAALAKNTTSKTLGTTRVRMSLKNQPRQMSERSSLLTNLAAQELQSLAS